MKNRLLIMLIISLFFLAACNPADEPTETPAADAVVQQPTPTDEPTPLPPTDTPPPEPTATPAATEPPSEAAADPAPTDTPLPEPTPTEAPQPTATLPPGPTPIPCPGSLTSPNQEGPFYSAGSPERASLIEANMPGNPILLIGRVFDQDCNPIAGSKLDFWLADVNGEYDNVGFTLRGHVFTDEEGAYRLESIEPTAYTGRPPHIHVKVFAPGGPELLTTQMYFVGSETSGDVQAAPDLLATYLEPDGTGLQQVLFNFVVQR